ncbi:MAG: nucleoside deaminase [Weeksellaceae bacterium]
MNEETMKIHEFFMRKCIELAKISKSHGESPVGSLLVLEGKVIGEGTEAVKTKNDLTCHAEIEAIRRANDLLKTRDLSGTVLYTTHEPCIMCAYMIRQSKIAMVVSGISTGEIGGYSSHLAVLTDDKIQRWNSPPLLVKGILENECAALND